MRINRRRGADERNSDPSSGLVQRHVGAAPAESVRDESGRIVDVSEKSIGGVWRPVRRLEHEHVLQRLKLPGEIRMGGAVAAAEHIANELKIPFVDRRQLVAAKGPIPP